MYQNMPPDIITEQIFWYSIQAYEAMKIAKRKIQSGYRFALVPKGSYIYTWVLQTTWYLLLDHQKKDIIIIANQNTNPENIEIYNEKVWPILWYNFPWMEFDSKNKVYLKSKDIPEDLKFQLSISRVVLDSKKYLYIGIWDNTKEKNILNLIKNLEKNYSESNVIFLSNLSQNEKIKQSKKSDQITIENIILQQKSEFIDWNIILSTYINFSKHFKQSPEIVMYANSWDFDWSKEKTNWFTCMVF